MNINPRQIKFGGNYTELYDFTNKRIVKNLPFSDAQVLSPAAAQYILVPSSILSGNIAKGVASTYSSGIVAAALPGAIGTAAITTISDSLGNVANIVRIRESTTHDPIEVLDREVFGLIQCASTVTDGDAIGAAASENLQMSFVYIAADGTVTLTAVTNTIEFQVRVMLTLENTPTYEVEGGNVAPDVVEPTIISQKVAKYVVTTAYLANEIINLVDGSGATAGVTTLLGDYAGVGLGASGAAFLADNQVEVLENGVEVIKQIDFVWDTSTTGHFVKILDIDDTFKVKYFSL